MSSDRVMLGHGSGGSMMTSLINTVFFEAYGNEWLQRGDDAALLNLGSEGSALNAEPYSGRLAFSTDSFVITPQFFPGGDIGRLAVCGTVNDVATSGATVAYLSCAFIVEEGYELQNLRRIAQSMAAAAIEAHVTLVTGDTKVVNRGAVDGVFITTSGIGFVEEGVELSGAFCRPGDKVLLSGTLGDHGITIMSCRESLGFESGIDGLKSDVAPLNGLMEAVRKVAPSVRCFRDPTRGGLASTLNELALQSGVNITVDESAIPVKPQVRGACELLGLDVLQVANEGKIVCVVAPDDANNALKALRSLPYGVDAQVIGEVEPTQAGQQARVFGKTAWGSRRRIDTLVGEQLPRIC